MFTTPSSICPEVAANFSYLGKLIKEEKIWNPTFMELASYFRLLEQLVFDLDTDGTVISNNTSRYSFQIRRLMDVIFTKEASYLEQWDAFIEPKHPGQSPAVFRLAAILCELRI